MSSLWDFYKSRFLALFLISLVLSLILQYATTLINFKELKTITDPLVMLEKLKDFILPMIILTLVSLLFSTILHYYILHNPLDRSCNIFICTLKSLKYYIPYLIIMILLAFFGSFVIALGILVLIIGVIFSIIYIGMICFFILPVMMVEGPHIGNTIVRTASLSHRNFWTNIGWVAVFLVLYIIISIILSGICLIPFAGSFMKTFMNPQDTSEIINLTTDPIFLFLSSAVNALTMPVLPIFGFILYFNGRAREEDIQIPLSGSDDNNRVRVEDLYAKPRIEDDQDIGEKV